MHQIPWAYGVPLYNQEIPVCVWVLTCTISLCLNLMTTRSSIYSVATEIRESSFPESRNDCLFIHIFLFSYCATIFSYDGKSVLQVSELVRRYYVHQESILTHLWETKPCPS